MATKTKTAVRTAATVDFMSAVAAVATTEKKGAKKNAKPTVSLKDLDKETAAALEANLAAVGEAKAAKAKAEADIKLNSAPLIAHARGIQDADALEGNFSGTYEIVGENNRALFISTDKWTVPQDDAIVNELKAIGAGAAVRERFEITVKEDVMLNKELQAEFMAAVGTAFAKFFDAKKVIETVPGLTENIYRLAGGDKVRVEKIRELVKQYSPYIK